MVRFVHNNDMRRVDENLFFRTYAILPSPLKYLADILPPTVKLEVTERFVVFRLPVIVHPVIEQYNVDSKLPPS